jgi:hypothetical protein
MIREKKKNVRVELCEHAALNSDPKIQEKNTKGSILCYKQLAILAGTVRYRDNIGYCTAS